MRRDIAGLAAAGLVGRDGWIAAKPLAWHVGVARYAQRAVVLLRTAYVERQLRRRDHVIPLRRRKVLLAPIRHPIADVVGDGAAAVVAVDHVIGIVGIDPQIVMIAMGVLADLYRGLAAVGRSEQRRVLHVDDVLVAGIAEDVRVVERALPNRAGGVDQLPRSAGIVRYKQAAVLVFDQRVDAIGVSFGIGETDATDDARRQPRVTR